MFHVVALFYFPSHKDLYGNDSMTGSSFNPSNTFKTFKILDLISAQECFVQMINTHVEQEK